MSDEKRKNALNELESFFADRDNPEGWTISMADKAAAEEVLEIVEKFGYRLPGDDRPAVAPEALAEAICWQFHAFRDSGKPWTSCPMYERHIDAARDLLEFVAEARS